MMPVAMVIDMVRHALLVVGNEGEAETSPIGFTRDYAASAVDSSMA